MMKLDVGEIINVHYKKICLLPIGVAIMVLMEWFFDYNYKIGDYHLRTITAIALVVVLLVANEKENQLNDLIARLKEHDSASVQIQYQGEEPKKMDVKR